MHMDPAIPTLVGTILAILVVGAVLRRLHQPHVVAWLVAGLLLGHHGLNLLPDHGTVARLGEFGVILLLFFVGMEVSVPRLLANWRVAGLGTLLQIAVSVGCVLAMGALLDWPVGRSVLLGFVISLSSTAVVISLLQDRGALDSEGGRDAVGVLLVQDMALIPMLMVVGAMSGDSAPPGTLALQVVGALGIGALLAWIARSERIHLPFGWLVRDHELQVLLAMVLCFGAALITGLLHLSAALGAFVGGIAVAAARETEWVHEALAPLRVVCVALFFVSVGMMVNLRFIADHALLIAGLGLLALLTNTVVNAVILRLVGREWSHAIYVATLLAGIGEFSFVLAAVGAQSGMISSFGYDAAVGTIALTLLVSPAWIQLGAMAQRRLRPRPAGV